jgi:hypothetical protein
MPPGDGDFNRGPKGPLDPSGAGYDGTSHGHNKTAARMALSRLLTGSVRDVQAYSVCSAASSSIGCASVRE